MPPYKKYPGRRYPNDPLDFFAGDFDLFDMDQFFDRMINEMHRSRSSISFEEMIEEIFGDKKGRNNRIVHGFCIERRSDGTTRFREFEGHPLKNRRGGPLITEEHKPTADIVDGKDEVAVTVDIPGVEREDIDLNVTEYTLEITVPKRNYHKQIMFPCFVKAKTMKATYKNGVLDIVVKKGPSQRRQSNEPHAN